MVLNQLYILLNVSSNVTLDYGTKNKNTNIFLSKNHLSNTYKILTHELGIFNSKILVILS